jgi:hypothetical protein
MSKAHFLDVIVVDPAEAVVEEAKEVVVEDPWMAQMKED